MKDSKLVEFFSQLSRAQLNQLGFFLESPYYNKKKELATFFEFIVQFYPDFNDNALSRQNAFAFIHPNKKYDEKAMGYYQSFLIKLIEEFLIVQELSERKVLRSSLLLRKLNDLNLDKPFNSALKNSRKLLKQIPYRNGIYFLDAYLVKRQENDFYYRSHSKEFDDSIQEAVNELDSFYFAEKLRYSCAMVNRKKHTGTQFNQRLFDEILQEITKEQHKEEPVIQIYSSILFGLLRPENENHFDQLKSLLIKYIDFFPKQEIRDQYIYAINYCVRKINTGKPEFYDEIFQLFKLLLENEVLLENGQLSPVEYMNIVSTAVQLEEYEWAERFILDYRPKLPLNIRNTAYNFNLAYLLFAQLEYDKAHKLLNKVEFIDIFYTLRTKVLILKLFYEQKDFDPLLTMAETFRVYLRRNKKIDGMRKKAYTNTISAILKMAKGYNNKRFDTQQLKQKIKEGPVTNQKWLLEKIGEIDKKHGRLISISRV